MHARATDDQQHSTTAGPDPAQRERDRDRDRERGAGVVEWLGISALSIALLATIFTALNAVGLDLVADIRATLGL